jgi:hypothetical protein
VRSPGLTGKVKQFEVNPARIRRALVWLLQNNPFYEEVEVDEEFFSKMEQNEEMQETSNVIDFDMGQMRAATTTHEVPRTRRFR